MTRLLVLLLLLCLLAAPALAQEPVVVTDAQSRFSAEIPAGWAPEAAEGVSRFRHPSDVTMDFLAVEAADKDAAVAAIWAIIDPDFDGTPVQVADLPGPGGVVWTQYLYIRGEVVDAVLVQMAGDTAYALVLRAPNLAAAGEVTPDINAALLSFEVTGSALAAGEAQPFTAALAAELTAFIESQREAFHNVGLAVAVVQGGETVFAQGFGQTALEDGAPVTADTRFMIGSTTKSMTSLLAAMLVDEGAWDWDTPVTQVNPDFALSEAEATAALRVRDLFNMSSGVPRFDIPLLLQHLTPQELLAEVAAIPLTAQPGEKFQYSNQLYALGGFLAAEAAGADPAALDSAYVALLAERLFTPLGMTRSTADFEAGAAGDDRAMPYAYNPDTEAWEVVPWGLERFVVPVAPAGSVWSTASDMARYLAFQLAGGATPEGERLVSAANLAATQSAEIAMPGAGAYGMGWMLNEYRGLRQIEHGGATQGFSSSFVFLPEAGLGVVVLSNRALDSTFGIAITQYVYELVFGLPHTPPEVYVSADAQLIGLIESTIAGLRTGPVDLDAAAAVVGQYERGVEVAIEGEALVVLAEEVRFPLAALRGQPNTYTTTGLSAGVVLRFDDDGVTVETALDLDPDALSTIRLSRLGD